MYFKYLERTLLGILQNDPVGDDEHNVDKDISKQVSLQRLYTTFCKREL